MKMTLKSLAIVMVLCCSSIVVKAQLAEKMDTLDSHEQRITNVEDGLLQLKKLKISGYVQTQWQSSEIDSLGKSGSQDMKVGAGKAGSETTDFNRFGVRRGRIKATYSDFGCTGVLQFDLTEKGVGLKDAYLIALDPWLGILSVKGGVFDRPFGYEISYSSSSRESPERSRIFQTLFPDERDLGGMLILQAPKNTPLNPLKLEAGLFAGNGIYLDNDSKKDFIGHLSYVNSTSTFKYGIGVSTYQGNVAQSNANVYTMSSGAYLLDNTATNKNGFAKRQYYGFDGQFSIASPAGLTTIRGEYLIGTQPSQSGSSSSPKSGFIPGKDASNNDVLAPTTYANNATTNVVTATTGAAIGTDTYIRDFNGGYVQLIQDIADTKHSIIVKYDFYDPNTNIDGVNIGKKNKTGKADMAYSTIGLGYIYRMNNNIKLTVYYDMLTNEQTSVKGLFTNINDNLVTVRMQYKF